MIDNDPGVVSTGPRPQPPAENGSSGGIVTGLGADQTISDETIGRALYEHHGKLASWDELSGNQRAYWRDAAMSVVPHIEAAIREKIAAEIIDGCKPGQAASEHRFGYIAGIREAAAVARGGSR